MLGIIYLILSGILGYELIKGILFQERGRPIQTINRFWVWIPASWGTGILLMTWGVYIVSWMASVCGNAENPLLYGNLAGFFIGVLALGFVFAKERKNRIFRRNVFAEGITNRKNLSKELIYFGVLSVFITYIMYYVFYIQNGILFSGFTVYGDYAPHTAMIRSFSLGNNFPTQYPHFGGADVKYHFMFQFLVGNLEYLGMPIDLAYNLPSIFSLLGFLMLLYSIAVRITGRAVCGVFTGILFFFRSGIAIFRFTWEHWQAGDLAETLMNNTSFIGYTMNENWGLWNLNVYLNQRHLAFGLLIISLAIWIYMDWVDAGAAHEEKGIAWIKGRAFSKAAWKCRSLETALLIGMLLGLLAFWNGATLIGGLLILMGFGMFSDGKLDYAVTAVTAVFFSVMQSRIFINGQAMSPKIQFGFLASEKTLWGVVTYLFLMSGFFFLGLVWVAFFLERKERIFMLSFLFPVIFAFCVSLTPDINVNHKYVMIAYAYLTIFWAVVLCRLFQKRIMGKLVAVFLLFSLTAMGIYDFAIILKGNGPGHRVGIRMESETTDWLAENLEKHDLLLTPQYSMSEATMSGVMMYCGWPYYAWSAGYDTNYRAAQAVTMYTTTDKEELKKVVEQEKITYILFEEGMEYEQRECREDVIRSTYPEVFESKDRRIRIYETSNKENNT